MNPVFWQLLLAAELPAHRAQAALEAVRTSKLDPQTALRTLPELSLKEKERIANADTRAWERALGHGVELIADLATRHPELSHACPALFVQGDATLLDTPKIGIVGTRTASTYGKAAAMKFAEHLVQAGATVVSGGAIGIDTAAHEGALRAEGKTIVVLPSAIDRPSPSANRELFRSVVARGGLIVSQFAVGAKTYPHFPLVRNGLVAAMSDALLVIEAPTGSGSLHTASAAAEMGKPVFVVPGNITAPGFRGSHNLIRDGATLVDHPNQILAELGWDFSALPAAFEEQELEPEHAQVLDALGYDTLNAEQIATKTGLDTHALLGTLTEMELFGLILRDGIGYSRAV